MVIHLNHIQIRILQSFETVNISHIIVVICFPVGTHFFQLLHALNLPDTTSKFRIVTVFIVVDLKAVFGTEFIGMFVSYLRTKFHIPYDSGSLSSLN
jgi:phosphate starvation-inducible membrane PsiE